MNPPQGSFYLLQNESRYNDPGSKTSRQMVLHLRKSLYGPRQSSHVWYGTCGDFVISNGFKVSRVDRRLFVLQDKDQDIVFASDVLYVDDLLIITNERLIGQIKDQVKK